MDRSDDDFPGFQTHIAPDEEFASRRPLSRLQRRAPRPLQLKKPPSCSAESIKSKSNAKSNPNGYNLDSSLTSSSSSSFPSYYYNSKGPIPLLSPLVLPSLLESTCIEEESTAKSHWVFTKLYSMENVGMFSFLVKRETPLYITEIFALLISVLESYRFLCFDDFVSSLSVWRLEYCSIETLFLELPVLLNKSSSNIFPNSLSLNN